MTVKTLPPKDYDSFPALAAPAGYVCVIRDIDSDRYRIDRAAQPGAYLEALMAEEERNFGLELVSVLQSDDFAATEAELYERYHARLSSDWLELDEYQLAALRRSVLRIDDFASYYLTPQRPPYVREPGDRVPGRPLTRYERLARAYMVGPNGMWRKRRRPPIPQPRYGADSLRRRIEETKRQRRQGGAEDVSQLRSFAKLLDEALVKRPRIILGILIFLLGLCRMTFDAMPL